MEWLINALVNAIKQNKTCPDKALNQYRKTIATLLANTLNDPINERSFPVGAACHMIALFNASLGKCKKLPKKIIFDRLIGSMMVALQYECDLMYMFNDYINPISLTFQENTTIEQLQKIEYLFLKQSEWKLSTNADEIMPAILPLIDENDIIPFWQELTAFDYFDSQEYVEFTAPRVERIYKIQLIESLLDKKIYMTQTYYAEKLILKRIDEFCMKVNSIYDIDIICKILSGRDFDALRKQHNNHPSIFFQANIPTLWDKIALTLSKHKNKIENNIAAFNKNAAMSERLSNSD